jgi:lysophospholipase L1-like esterase
MLDRAMTDQPNERTQLAVFGDSTIAGLGVRGGAYGALLARRLGLEYVSHANPGAIVGDSFPMLEDAGSYEVVLVSHGGIEGLVRPTERSLRWMPPRWRRNGWMDPRAYFPSSRLRALPKRIESAVRWRVKVMLIRLFGGRTLIGLGEFAPLLEEFVQGLKARGVPTIVLMGPVCPDERFYPGSQASLDGYNAAIAAIARNEGVHFVRAGSELRQWDDYFRDHLHATAGGHERIAAKLEGVVADAGGSAARRERNTAAL